jgi:hypothetical protein
MSLLDDEAGADAQYGFPSGTLEALGATESSQGTNLGSIGNVFQILPSTAAKPGYGLGQLDGNNAYDAGAYLSALQNGPANGSLSQAFAMYQGGAGNPTPYGSNTPVAAFLASLTGGGSSTGSAGSAPVDDSGSVAFGIDGMPSYGTNDTSAAGTAAAKSVNSAATGIANGAKAVANAVSPTAWFKALQGYLGSEATNFAFILVGVIILVGAFFVLGKSAVEKIT